MFFEKPPDLPQFKVWQIYGKSRNDGLVYGTIQLTLLNHNLVISKFDVYDFDMHSGNSIKTWARNIQTKIAQYFAGTGNSFKINFYGLGKLK